MKKLLYIFALAATIVACDKDGGLEMEDPTALTEQEIVEAEESGIIINAVDYDARFANLNNFLRKTEFPKADTSTNKGGDNGADWIELVWFNHTSDNYVYTRPDGLGNACSDNINDGVSLVLHETYSYDSANQSVHIQVDDEDGADFAIPSDLQAQYAAAFVATDSALYFSDYESETYSFRTGALPTEPTVVD